MYPEEICKPMREELTQLGVKELRTEQEVTAALADHKGTALLVINSVCGCASAARPAVALALEQTDKKPNELYSVFAGQDAEATHKARELITEYPPSSPAIALFKDAKVVAMLERQHIQGRGPEAIAEDLVNMLNEFC